MNGFDFEIVADGAKAERWVRRLEQQLDEMDRKANEASRAAREFTDTLARGASGATTVMNGLVSALQREQRILQSIRGPAREYQADLAAVQKLHRQGTITTEEYTRKVNQLTQAFQRQQSAQSGVGVPGAPKGGGGGLGSMLGGARGAAAALGVGVGVKEIGDLANEYQNLQNRLRFLAGGDMDKVNELFEKTQTIARRTRMDLSATTESFVRMSLATQQLGLSNDETLQLTERLNKAIALSGATGAEAAAGMIQLSQGLASGALRGDELRSVMEQLPAVADVIAKGMGVTRGELRKFGADGKITADVIIDAFRKVGPELDAGFANTVPTISQSFTLFKNELVVTVGELDRTLGVSKMLGSALSTLADVIKLAVIPLQVLGEGLSAFSDATGISMNAGTALGFMMGGPLGAAIGTAAHAALDAVGAFDDMGGGIARLIELDDQFARNRGKMVLAMMQGAEALKKAHIEQTEFNLRLTLGAAAADAFRQSFERAARATDAWGNAAASSGISGAMNDLASIIGGNLGRAFDKLNDKVKKHKAELTDEQRVLKELRGPQEMLDRKLVALETLFARGAITIDEYNDALDRWLKRTDDVARAMLGLDLEKINRAFTGDGFSKGMQKDVSEIVKVAQELNDAFRKAAQENFEQSEKFRIDQLNVHWKAALEQYEQESRTRAELLGELWAPVEDSLKNMFVTGEFGLDQFAEKMEEVLASLAIKILMTTALMKGLGLSGAYVDALGGSSALGQLMGFATGGQFMVGGRGGTDSQVVAFRATPGERVTVETPGQQNNPGRDPSGGGAAPMMAPVVINNHFDRRSLLSGLATPEGTTAVYNVIRDNPGAVRAALQKSRR